MSRVLIFLLIVTPILIYLAWPVQDEKRIALVLGNSNYIHSKHIGSSAINARDMSRSLRRLGFDVIEGTNLTHIAVRSSLEKFVKQMKGADVALFYYSGYVHQAYGRTYITPIEAQPTEPHQLEFQTVNLLPLLKDMANSAHSNLILFDACRADLHSFSKRSLDDTCQPLKPVPIEEQMMISYPAQSSLTLTDMQNGNSRFTKSFLDYVNKEITNSRDASLSNTMLAVQKDIALKTRSHQNSWAEFSFSKNYSLNLASSKGFEDSQLTVVDNPPVKEKDNLQSTPDASDTSNKVVLTSKSGPNSKDNPAIDSDKKNSSPTLSAILPDDQTVGPYDKKIRSNKKRKVKKHATRIRKRVTRRSWQKRQLHQMLESRD